ncbi:hypothetical protein ACE6H2_004699 [Prunus campanulata]
MQMKQQPNAVVGLGSSLYCRLSNPGFAPGGLPTTTMTTATPHAHHPHQNQVDYDHQDLRFPRFDFDAGLIA